MSTIFSALMLALSCLLLCLPGLRRAGSQRYVLASALLIFAFILAAWSKPATMLPGLRQLAGHDHWTSQLLVLLVGSGALVLLGMGGWQRAEFGLQLSFNPGTGADARRYLLPLLVLEGGLLWKLVPGGHPGWEGMLFQLVAPSLTEELIFRGVLLALLDRAFTGRRQVLGAQLGWGGVASSLVFGLCHGLRVGADFEVNAQVLPMAIPMAGGLVLAWCRARSGSLLLPVFVHGGMNEVAQLVALAKAAC